MNEVKISEVKVYEYKINADVHFTYVKVDEIPKKYKEEFLLWMVGQEIPRVENDADKEVKIVYSWDWGRWINNKHLKESCCPKCSTAVCK